MQQQQDGQHGGGHWEKGHIAQQQPRGHETPVRGTAGLGDLHVFKLYVCCVLLQALRDLLCCNIVCEAACCCMLGCIRYRGFCCWVFFSSCVSSWKLCVARWAASDIGALGRSWSPVGPTLPGCPVDRAAQVLWCSTWPWRCLPSRGWGADAGSGGGGDIFYLLLI